MPKFRKKPVVIEAMQLPDVLDIDARLEFDDWAVANGGGGGVLRYVGNGVQIVAPIGETQLARPGDWITLDGRSGLFHVCGPVAFTATYEPAAAPEATSVEGTSAPTPTDPPLTGGWGWHASFDGGERYTVGPEATRDAIIAAARLDAEGMSFTILEGRQAPIQVSDSVDAELILDAVEDQELGDPDGDPLTADVTKEQAVDLTRRVADAVDRWQDHHGIVLLPWAFTDTRNEETIAAVVEGVVCG